MALLFFYRCTRCGATFSAEDPEEKYGLLTWRELLEKNPCRLCKKGSVEYVGYHELD